jgi:hypothetical protein
MLNPSFTNLLRLADAVEVDLSVLIAEAEDARSAETIQFGTHRR